MMKNYFKILFLFLFTLSLSATTFNQAAKYYKEKKYYKSFTAFEELANKANINAQYNLAMMYYRGIGVKQNKVLAFIWFKTSADAGHKLAQNKLGYMYEKGEVEGIKSEKKAMKEYKKSALQNYDIAQLNLGMKYNSNIKKESLKKAIFWYKKAIENNNTGAMNNLANMYYAGQAIKKDYKKAFNLYLKAAKLEDKIAQFNLSMMYYNGNYIKQNDKKALYWLKLSAKNGSAIAQVRLANFYREGYNLVDQDYKKAFKWYLKAAKQKSSEGEFYVGFCYFYGYGVEKNKQEAAKWMFYAKEHGYIHAKTFMKRNKLYY
jgi:hypothetical protein